jgi:hypothetical protein
VGSRYKGEWEEAVEGRDGGEIGRNDGKMRKRKKKTKQKKKMRMMGSRTYARCVRILDSFCAVKDAEKGSICHVLVSPSSQKSTLGSVPPVLLIR